MRGVVKSSGDVREETINLGIGQPSADLLPVELLREASESFFSSARPLMLNYGDPAGDESFLTSLAGLLSEGYRATVSPDSLFVTGGSSQGLDLVSTVFADAGDTVFVEEPTYFLAYQILRDHGLKLVGVPVDDGGMQMDVLEALLEEHRPAFVYTIPSYHNPGGQCMGAERRIRLVELSREYGFHVVADEVYQLLHYGVEPPPAFGTMLEGDTVLSLGSFSKILAPGLRLGWIQTGARSRERLMSNGMVRSGGSMNHHASLVVGHAIELGLQGAHIQRLREVLGNRISAMQESLDRHFRDLATWDRPEGGYFFWLQFPETMDTGALQERAEAYQTGFQPGKLFSIQEGLSNYLRLSFAHYDEEDIREGIRRLREAFESQG